MKAIRKKRGVDFYDGEAESAADLEVRLWIEAILNGTEPVVRPEEAYAATRMLEAICESAKTGAPVFFTEWTKRNPLGFLFVRCAWYNEKLKRRRNARGLQITEEERN